MRLFYQLTIEEKEVSLQHCLHKIIHDLLSEKIEIKQLLDDLDIMFLVDNANADQEDSLNNNFLTDYYPAFEKAKKLDNYQDKVDILMENENTTYLLMEAASALAEKTFYHEPDENIIYPDVLLEDHDSSECTCDVDEEETSEQSKRKKQSMN